VRKKLFPSIEGIIKKQPDWEKERGNLRGKEQGSGIGRGRHILNEGANGEKVSRVTRTRRRGPVRHRTRKRGVDRKKKVHDHVKRKKESCTQNEKGERE